MCTLPRVVVKLARFWMIFPVKILLVMLMRSFSQRNAPWRSLLVALGSALSRHGFCTDFSWACSRGGSMLPAAVGDTTIFISSMKA